MGQPTQTPTGTTTPRHAGMILAMLELMQKTEVPGVLRVADVFQELLKEKGLFGICIVI